ncbi:MAG: hypothetical protein ACLFPL_04545 [Candidatus Nanoarchaeia archaeon]
MSIMNNKRGVFFLEIALVILFIISLYTFVNSQISTQEDMQEKRFSLEVKKIQAKQLCSQLVLNPGNPSNWSSASSLILLGLKEENSNYISINKTQELNNIDASLRNQLKLQAYEVEARYLQNNSVISKMNNVEINNISLNFVSHTCYGIDSNLNEIEIEVRVR